jgi:DNA-binding NarL/FixJ family response regulator
MSSSQDKRIRLLLADDHPVVRKGILSCLMRQPGLEVVGEAGDGDEALAKAKELTPDLVLMDVDMPGLNGLAVTEVLRKELPQTRVLILSMHSSPEYAMRTMEAGARGYVLKEASPEELLRAIQTVNAGDSYFSPDLAQAVLNRYVQENPDAAAGERISHREREVLIQIAEGLSNKEIACRLGVGVRTVETHRERIMRKLNIHSVAGLTKYAISKGLVALREESGPGH